MTADEPESAGRVSREGTPPEASPEPADTAPGSDPASAPTGSATPDVTARRNWRGKPRKPRRKAPWWELPLLVAIAVVAAILIKTFIIQPFYIPSASMEKTLLGDQGHNDRILVSKLSFDFGDPSPGDIVVFNAPAGWEPEAITRPPSNPVARGFRDFGQLIGVVPPDTNPLIKRVMAVGGQTIKCCDAQGRVQVADSPNGPFRSLVEPYAYFDPENNQNQEFGPVTVPKGDMWVMGDHRNNSADSRVHCADMQPCTNANDQNAVVPIKNVIGKAVVIAWPPSRWRTLGTPKDFTDAAGAAGPGAIGASFAAVALVLPLRRRRSRGRSNRRRRR